jgi:hypothetical protein
LLWRRNRHTYLWLRRGRSHWRAGRDLGSQWQPETEQAENEPEQPRNVDARKQAGILMCGRGKCQGRFPQAKIVCSPAGPARDRLRGVGFASG